MHVSVLFIIFSPSIKKYTNPRESTNFLDKQSKNSMRIVLCMKKSGKHFPISFETLNLDKLLTRRQEKAFSVKLLASTHASMYRERERETCC